MKMCSGAMFVANTTSRVIFLGVVATNAGATGTFGIAHEPWGLDSLTRLHEFGDGSGLYPATSGTTLDGQQYLPALEITSGSLTQNSISVTNPPLVIFSQNPVLITNTGTINLNLKGRPGASGGNTAGAGGNSCGFGGSGGGGGGGGTTGVQGGSGGGHSSFFAYATSNGGNGGIAGNGAGGTGSGYSAILDLRGVYIIGGCGGGSGGGDLTTKLGGAGGQGGGGIYLKAPSIVINTSTNPSANGDVGGAPSGCSTGKCGGGGGGAGGTFILDGYFVENSATIHVDGGAGAAPVGTAGAGGAGGAGVVQIIERQ